MIEENPALSSIGPFRRAMLLAIIAMGFVGTVAAWFIMAARGMGSPALAWLQGVSAGVLLVLFVATWWRLLPHRMVAMCALAYMVCVCLACMGLRMYLPQSGAALALAPLYLWMPVLYVFAFMLTGHKTGLVISVSILVLLVAVSVPWLVHNMGAPDANITVQMQIMSVVLIVALYFYSGYRYRLRQAHVKVHELTGLSQTDELTGLANRRAMAAMIDAELAHHGGGGADCALLLFDIDRFKDVNDGFGHAEGDNTLAALSARARALLRDSATLARWGGDEFVALVPATDAEQAMRLADDLCAGVAATLIGNGRTITISCGVTAVRGGDNVDGILQRADAALYAAKRAGRNCVASVFEQR